MKRVLALSVVLALCLGAVALAGDKTGKKAGKMSGTITKVDNDQKMMVVKDKAGKESTIYWNADTKVEGDGPKEGEKVWFTATEKDGKMWATWVKSGAAKAKM
jgi:hypothetical protein